MRLINDLLDWISARRSTWLVLLAPVVFLRILFTRLGYYLELIFNAKTTINDLKKQKRFRKKSNTSYTKISFCTTCMNRLSHLKKTLPQNLEDCKNYPNVEFVILNYGSKDELHSWILDNYKKELKSGLIKYYRTQEPKEFNRCHAKNLAHDLANGEVVCNIDADNFCGKNLPFLLDEAYKQDKNCFVAFTNKGIFLKNMDSYGGRIALSKKNFQKIGGYWEEFVGWGNEDNEIRLRAEKNGLNFVRIPLIYAKVIYHSDFFRFKDYSKKTKILARKNWDLMKNSPKIVKRRFPAPKDLRRFIK